MPAKARCLPRQPTSGSGRDGGALGERAPMVQEPAASQLGVALLAPFRIMGLGIRAPDPRWPLGLNGSRHPPSAEGVFIAGPLWAIRQSMGQRFAPSPNLAVHYADA